ncbi:type 1 glutamine amidotransferase domain-containing protein [Salicibibacter halophilus]|uniref:Type 1 glutamine amidotransferase domain-containing protein n=1 Tax=Salicibibacter halophilus TaxID=2502791 RepID=A0A514LK36_9BACI|nr:type 1 glutamine amidotransferase domain-containing protein [Salicibibacter halophilus]QDI92220.1 type 1 glutamine amidotransferase domain-containing protein [Salicibibacter halophilus]
MANNKKILMVVTNGQEMSNGHFAGIWLSEFAEPYEELRANGYEVTVVSPKGGESRIDKNSLENDTIPDGWQEIARLLKNTEAIDNVNADDYEGIFLPGGHGTMFDFPDNAKLHSLLRNFAEDGKSIGAVCHGPAGLVGATLNDGTPIVKNKTVTAFTDSEERGVQLENEVPFMLESKLRELGASFVTAEDWAENTQTDGKLVTGQNPQSSISVAKQLVKTLEA